MSSVEHHARRQRLWFNGQKSSELDVVPRHVFGRKGEPFLRLVAPPAVEPLCDADLEALNPHNPQVSTEPRFTEKSQGIETLMIYFIQSGETGPIKIGVTAGKPQERFCALQTGSPEPMRLLGTTRGDKDTETYLHNEFARFRIRGEWFKAEPELILAINQLVEPGTAYRVTIDDPPILDAKEKPSLTIREVARTVSSFYNVSLIDILSHRRTAVIMRPRHVIFYLCRKLTTRSLPEIGRRLGHRDHTTVMHGARKVEAQIQTDPQLACEVEAIHALLIPAPTEVPIEG